MAENWGRLENSDVVTALLQALERHGDVTLTIAHDGRVPGKEEWVCSLVLGYVDDERIVYGLHSELEMALRMVFDQAGVRFNA